MNLLKGILKEREKSVGDFKVNFGVRIPKSYHLMRDSHLSEIIDRRIARIDSYEIQNDYITWKSAQKFWEVMFNE